MAGTGKSKIKYNGKWIPVRGLRMVKRGSLGYSEELKGEIRSGRKCPRLGG